MADQDKPKIVVDEDWKHQAQAEKQRLADETQKAGAGGPAAGAAGAAAGGQAKGRRGAEQEEREIPPASFGTLVSGLVTQILFALGMIEDPSSGRRYRDLDLAKHHIDTLAVIEDKTRGNLTDEEKKMLDNALYEVRMAYVQVAQGSAL